MRIPGKSSRTYIFRKQTQRKFSKSTIHPCRDLVFTHEEQIPRWEGGREKKPEETKRKRFGSQVKRKATSDNVRAKYYKIVNIERLKHINQG